MSDKEFQEFKDKQNPKNFQRPQIILAIENYASVGAPLQDICDLLLLTTNDILTDSEYTLALTSGQAMFRMMIRRYQATMAPNNANMAIWLGKQYLGQRDFKDDGSETKQQIEAAVQEAVKTMLDQGMIINPTLANKVIPIKKLKDKL